MTKVGAITTLHKGLSHARKARPGRESRGETHIVPRGSIAGNALASVVAIMTFLAAVTSGGVAMVIASANGWEAEVSREMTILVRPMTNRDIEADIAKAQQLAKATTGVASVHAYSREESNRLLEPWLGSGLSFEDLPVPRMIAIQISQGGSVDTASLSRLLAQQVASAHLDDHRAGISRIRGMAKAAIVAGMGVLLLVLAATLLSVAFATRGAMSSNRAIVEVLHFVGAKEAYIASQFQRHFLGLGLKGGALGGIAAILSLMLIRRISDLSIGAGEVEATAMVNRFAMGFAGYFVVAAEMGLIAAVTALTSRQVVIHTLRHIE
jgi:cell division transport system permease protein